VTVPRADKASLRVTCSVERVLSVVSRDRVPVVHSSVPVVDSGVPVVDSSVPVVDSSTASLTTATHCNALKSVGVARLVILTFAELPELLAQQSALGNGGLQGRVFRLRIETWRQRANPLQGACAHLL